MRKILILAKNKIFTMPFAILLLFQYLAILNTSMPKSRQSAYLDSFIYSCKDSCSDKSFRVFSKADGNECWCYQKKDTLVFKTSDRLDIEHKH